jgi:malate dehydrogenase (oxaloacetate-decarboxylating)
VVINGAGAAGRAIAHLLTPQEVSQQANAVQEVIICDSRGILHSGRQGNGPLKEELARRTNPHQKSGTLKDALVGADVFIGVSRGNLLTQRDIASMAKDSIVLAMANPIPKIIPEEASAGGAAIVGTGRSDFPNQVNNVLSFPGPFRGALEARATRFPENMKLAAVDAITTCIEEPTPRRIRPLALDRSVAIQVAQVVREAALAAKVSHGYRPGKNRKKTWDALSVLLVRRAETFKKFSLFQHGDNIQRDND